MHSGWEDGHGSRASVERTAAACNAGGGRSLKRTALSGFAERPVRASRERLLHAMAVDRISSEPFSGLNSLLIGKITGSPSLLLLLPRCFTVTPLPISRFSSPCSENHDSRQLSTSRRLSFWVLGHAQVDLVDIAQRIKPQHCRIDPTVNRNVRRTPRDRHAVRSGAIRTGSGLSCSVRCP